MTGLKSRPCLPDNVEQNAPGWGMRLTVCSPGFAPCLLCGSGSMLNFSVSVSPPVSGTTGTAAPVM